MGTDQKTEKEASKQTKSKDEKAEKPVKPMTFSQDKSEVLKQELEKAKEALEAEKDKHLRAVAEQENLRRRARIDLENAHKYGSEKFSKELISVIDSLERGLEASKGESEDVKVIHEGMELTHKMFLDTLAKFGVEQIDPIDKPFDPAQHEALTAAPNPDVEPNTVMQVVQKGFILYGRVLRPARVVVSKAPEAS